jgi:hypothetical protein
MGTEIRHLLSSLDPSFACAAEGFEFTNCFIRLHGFKAPAIQRYFVLDLRDTTEAGR